MFHDEIFLIPQIFINNHRPFFCGSNQRKKDSCVSKHIDRSLAMIPHYRASPHHGIRGKKQLETNTIIWKYRNQLELNVNEILVRLNWL